MNTFEQADPVVISGVGVVHGLGATWETFGAALMNGQCSIDSLSNHATMAEHASRAKMFSWLPSLPPTSFPPEKEHLLSRLAQLALACTEQAHAQAGFASVAVEASAIGVFLGSGMANLADLDPVYATYHSPRGKRGLSPLTLPIHMNNSPANVVSQVLGAEGPSVLVSTACASGMSALFQACDALASGKLERAYAGGVDLTVVPTLVDAWDKLGVLSPETEDPTRACRPLHRGRNGMVLGEGGAVFALERLSTCRSRGGRVLAVVRGGHQNCDAADLVAPRAETQRRCLQRALRDANVLPDQLGLVHLHGTGTPRNDVQELEVLAAELGPHLATLPLAAIKAQTGHCLGASGVLSLAAELYRFEYGGVFRLPWAEDLEWSQPLHVSGETEPAASGVSLIQCFAMGGSNAILLVDRGKGERHGT